MNSARSANGTLKHNTTPLKIGVLLLTVIVFAAICTTLGLGAQKYAQEATRSFVGDTYISYTSAAGDLSFHYPQGASVQDESKQHDSPESYNITVETDAGTRELQHFDDKEVNTELLRYNIRAQSANYLDTTASSESNRSGLVVNPSKGQYFEYIRTSETATHAKQPTNSTSAPSFEEKTINGMPTLIVYQESAPTSDGTFMLAFSKAYYFAGNNRVFITNITTNTSDEAKDLHDTLLSSIRRETP